MFRKTIFWTHLVVGIVNGVVVFILCLTGALLAFDKPIIDWTDRAARALPPAGAAALLSPDALLASAAKVEPGKAASMEWFSDARMPVRVRYGNQSTLLLNGYTGEVLGHGSASLRGFFAWVTKLHVSLLMKLTGAQIVGVSNVCFVILILSGLYLWWPRQWRWNALRNSVAFRLDARGKARDWNWHNAFGFWFLPPLLVMAASGLVLSFKPVNLWWRDFASIHLLAPAPPSVRSPLQPPAPALPAVARDWNDSVRAVQRQYPGWRSITLAVESRSNGPSGPEPARRSALNLTIRTGESGQLTQSYLVKLDNSTHAILKASGWAELDAARRARAIARLGHSGEILGFWGRALALFGCLAGCMLIYTGFALSWRRFFGRKTA